MPENPPEYSDESNGEASLFSFVVYLWKEDSGSEDQISWRGHITPIPNGERHYFKDIGEIPDLIVAHLNMRKGVK